MCDNQLLVSSDDRYLNLRILSRKESIYTTSLVVNLVVNLNAEELHIVANPTAQVVRVLTYTTSEDNHINTTHSSSVCTNIFLNAIGIGFYSVQTVLVALICGFLDIPQVVAHPGDAQQTALLLKEIVPKGESENWEKAAAENPLWLLRVTSAKVPR